MELQLKTNKWIRILEPLIVSATVLLFTALNVWHIILHYFSNKPGQIFIGISHYHEDYFYYLSQVRQGMDGAWAVKNLYTSEPIPATFLWWPNVMLGKIGKILSLPPWTIYDWSLILASGMSLFLLYVAARKLFPKDAFLRVGSFLMAVTSTMLYVWKKYPDGKPYPDPYSYFYNYTASLNRLGGVFHLILQNILSLLLILTAADIIKIIFSPAPKAKPLAIRTVLLSVTATILMFINPIYVAVDAVSVAVVSLGYLIRFFSLKRLGKLLYVALITGAPLIIPYMAVTSTFNIPFYQYFRWWESSVLTTTPDIFFHSMGFIFVLAVIGIIPFLAKGSPLRILGTVWTVLPIGLYFTIIPRLLEFPYFRLHQPPSYIFLGAMAAEALYIPANVLKKLIRSDTKFSCFARRSLGEVGFIFFLLAFIAFQIPMITTEVASRQNNFALYAWLNHMEPDMYRGLLAMNRFPKDGLVISMNNPELLIPVVSGHTVYAGHHSLTYDFGNKIVPVIRIMTGQMPPDEALQFLKTNHIKYLFWRKLDGPCGAGKAYPFLKTLFENNAAVIYSY